MFSLLPGGLELAMRSIDITCENGVTVATLGLEYESIFGAELGHFQDVVSLADSVDPPRLVLDLRHTSYFGSGFLGILVQLAKQIKRRPGGQFGVSNVSGLCKDIITGTRMEHYFDLFDTKEDAVARYSQGKK
jgi:anti-anti-sigma factor